MSDTELRNRIAGVLHGHRGSAARFCIHPDCRRWDGDTYQNPRGSGSQPDGYMERHVAEMVIRELGLTEFSQPDQVSRCWITKRWIKE